MNYEQKYKEALERAKKLYEQGTITESLNYIFPELKESENEKIRKSLIDMLKNDEKCYLKEIAWLEKQGKSKPYVTWFNTKDTTAPSERDIVGWYKTGGKLEPCPITVWFCSEEEARKEAEENNDCFLAYWAELPEQGFEKNYWFEKQVDKPQGKTALDAINEEIADNANKVEPKDYNSIDPHFTKPTENIEPKFKVKYANSCYNVLETKEINGVTYYVIEDEANHIDYIQAENCEIINGYAIKENGSPYPTKPAVFS